MSLSEEQLSTVLPQVTDSHLFNGERLRKALEHEPVHVRHDYLEMVKLSIFLVRAESTEDPTILHLGTIHYSNELNDQSIKDQHNIDQHLVFNSTHIPRSPHGPSAEWEVELPKRFVRALEARLETLDATHK